MNNSYTILNRKSSFIINTFLLNILILMSFVVWGINTFYYQSFIQLHSKILYFDSFYYMEVLVPAKEVKQITEQSKIIIDEKTYDYKIYKTDNKIRYENNVNYQKIYLKVYNLDASYLIDGYEIDAIILKEKKKIIDYIRE